MADAPPDNWWPDEEYVPYLEADQQLYAWVLVKVGGIEPAEAMRRAVARFHYEPMSVRGMMTHEGAWRIAMSDLFGDHCRDPEEFGLAAEYEAEFKRLFHHTSWFSLSAERGTILRCVECGNSFDLGGPSADHHPAICPVCGVECVYLDWKGRIIQIVLKNAPPVLAQAIRIMQDRFDELEFVELLVALEELVDALYKPVS